jgi:phosphatidylinositol alpha-1,6-mannosyltransferase
MKFWNLPPEKMRVHHNGVNLDQFSPNPALGAAERTRLQISKPVVLYVGRVCEQKGTDILIEAFRHLHRRIEDIQLVIAGPIGQFGVNQDNTHWLRQIRSVGGLYLGAVEEERLSGIYNLCDVFTMPTREHEMFGMAAVEAQSCGKPTVASDHGGLRETVPETCGARFRVGDPVDLAAKIEQLLKDPSSYAARARNARRNALNFGWKKVVKDLFDIYQNKPIRLQTVDALPHSDAAAPAQGVGLESCHESIKD